MKILFLQDDFPPRSFGGAGISAFDFAKAIERLGQDVSVITAVGNKSEERQGEYCGLKIFRIYSNYHRRWRAYLSLYNPQTVKKVRNIINDVKPDVVHARNIHYHLSYHCLKIAKQSGAKVFFTAHDAMVFHYDKFVEFIDPCEVGCVKKFNYHVSPWQQLKKFKKRYNPFRNIVIRYYFTYVDKIFAISNALKEALAQNNIKGTEVLYNAIDVSEWQIEQAKIYAFQKKYNLQDKQVILFGGRVSSEKGGYQAILAMKRVIDLLPSAVLLVIGNTNGYATTLAEIAQEIGISQNIIFTGWILGDELKAAYHASHIVIVPSLYLDPFVRINIEAMACRKPVIATCFGGSQEIVKDGFSGYIVNPYNTMAFSEKIVYLLNNPHKAKELGENGYILVQKKFSLEEQAKKHLAWYQAQKV